MKKVGICHSGCPNRPLGKPVSSSHKTTSMILLWTSIIFFLLFFPMSKYRSTRYEWNVEWNREKKIKVLTNPGLHEVSHYRYTLIHTCQKSNTESTQWNSGQNAIMAESNLDRRKLHKLHVICNSFCQERCMWDEWRKEFILDNSGAKKRRWL